MKQILILSCSLFLCIPSLLQAEPNVNHGEVRTHFNNAMEMFRSRDVTTLLQFSSGSVKEDLEEAAKHANDLENFQKADFKFKYDIDCLSCVSETLCSVLITVHLEEEGVKNSILQEFVLKKDGPLWKLHEQKEDLSRKQYDRLLTECQQ